MKTPDALARSPLAAVLWDMDGTLADSEPLHQRTLTAALAAVGIHADPAWLDDTIGLAEAQVHALCVRRHGLAMDLASWSGFRNATYAVLCRELRPRGGALEALRRIEAHGIAQAVVSNSTRTVLDLSLRALGLDALPSVSRSDVAHGKPDPAPYRLAARRLNVAPGATVVVEDSPVGALAGLAAGMQVVAWPAPGLSATSFPAGCDVVGSGAALLAALSSRLEKVS